VHPDDRERQRVEAIRRVVAARSRQRNIRAGLTSLGLVVVASILTVMLAASFGGGDGDKSPAVKKVAKAKPRATTSTRSSTSTSSTSTSTSSSTSSTTSTTLPPATTSTVRRTTTTQAPRTTTTRPAPVSATVKVRNKPKFCTVIVTLSTGAQKSYALDKYLANPGDSYSFTATLGGYNVDVETHVESVDGESRCVATLSHLVKL
jgi:hypothetical protein